MSRFTTALPVYLSQITDALPNGVHIESIELQQNTGRVIVNWSHAQLKTPYTFHVEFPLDMLKSQKLPDGVKRVDWPPPVEEASTKVLTKTKPERKRKSEK